MSRAALQELRDQLRGEPPRGVRALPGEDLRHLAEAIHDARARQAAALSHAADQGFSYVPRLLRGPIRRVLR